MCIAKYDLVKKWNEYRYGKKDRTKAGQEFIESYNLELLYKELFQKIGKVAIGTIYDWDKKLRNYDDNWHCLIKNYSFGVKTNKKSGLSEKEEEIFLSILLHPNQIKIGKAIKLTKTILEQRGVKKFSCDMTYRRFINNYKKEHYDTWVFAREGHKALHDKVLPYITRDISKLEVGDVIIGDGHKLAFQVINPYTGNPTRATMVAYQEWKSGAMVGFEIMLEENKQCVASALRNAIITLGKVPKYVYHDNGKSFKAKYFTDDKGFSELGFQGLYSKLGIETIFARPYNAKAKPIERFFKEFQETFEQLMPSYTGISIEQKPAKCKRNEKFHQKIANTYIPTIQEVIKYINCWLEFHNKKPCPKNRSKSIQEMLDSIQKQNININILNTLMMKTEYRTITKHGITFLNMHYRSDAILGLREQVFIRYSLFDLSKIYVYSSKGEFLCVAKRVQKVHPMANILGTVKDMEEYKQQYKKQQQIKSRLIKQIKKNFTSDELQVLEIEGVNEELTLSKLPQKILSKPKREKRKRGRAEGESISDTRLMRAHKTTPREQQMNRPIFSSNYEKYEWLMKNGCTNSDDRNWLTQYIRSDEYYNLYID